MKGPAWVLYGVHAPNGPPRHGNRYLVHAWGITCKKARSYLRAFFPKIPPHPMGTLKGGPKGFKCKGRDPKGTVTKSKPHDGSCLRRKPAATFDWGPTGGKRRLRAGPLQSAASAPVAQLDRASVYGTEGQRFESSRARQENPANSEVCTVGLVPFQRAYPARTRRIAIRA